ARDARQGAVQQHPRDEQRWIGRDVEETSREEEREALHVVLVDPSDALHALVAIELLRGGVLVEDGFVGVPGRAVVRSSRSHFRRDASEGRISRRGRSPWGALRFLRTAASQLRGSRYVTGR